MSILAIQRSISFIPQGAAGLLSACKTETDSQNPEDTSSEEKTGQEADSKANEETDKKGENGCRRSLAM